MTSSSLESPGVFITETLAPVSNNNVPGEAIAVLAANYNQGPSIPTLVTSWNQFLLRFGSFAQAAGNTALHYAAYQFFNNGGAQVYILAVPNTDAVTAVLTLQDVNSPPDNIMTFSAISPGTWGNTIYIAITSAGNTGRFNVQVYNGGTAPVNLVESFIDLSVNPSDTRNIATIVNSPNFGSNYVTLRMTLPGAYTAGISDPALISATPLSGGSNGSTPPVMSSAVPAQLDMLQGTILNVNLPGVSDAVTINTLAAWATGRGDVMLIVDGPVPSTSPQTSAQVVTNYTNMVTGGTPVLPSAHVTIYAPWIQITDPASLIPGAARWVPPGGAVAGVWSRTDADVGPWQTPAGVSFGRIALVNLEAQFTSSDLDTLNTSNINAIRFVPSYFPAVMGGRTLSQGYPDRYISVRRMLIKLEHDFTFLLQPALFEPNTDTLRLQVVHVLVNYLTQLMQSGSLGGTTPADTFQVICDDSNNTPASTSSGIVNASVAVALTSPAEFILINISQFQNTGTTTITTSPTPGT